MSSNARQGVFPKSSPQVNIMYIKGLEEKDMQQTVVEFIKKYEIYCDTNSRYIDVVSEIGELGKELLKSSKYGTEQPTATHGTVEEIGDCFFSLLALCTTLEIDSEQALNSAILKYQKRFDAKSDISSGR